MDSKKKGTTKKQFAYIPIDQAQEQNIEVVKGHAGVVSLSKPPVLSEKGWLLSQSNQECWKNLRDDTLQIKMKA